MRTGGRFLMGMLCAVLLVASGASCPGLAGSAHAAGPRLFFSEYIEGSGNNKALEIYNGTGAAVDLDRKSVV